MTTRDELIQLIDDLPDDEQAELVERLKTRRDSAFGRHAYATSRTASGGEIEPRASASWDTIGPAAFGAAVLLGFAAGLVGGQVGPLLAAIGALAGLAIGSVVDRRLASAGP